MPKLYKKTYRDEDGNLKYGGFAESYYSLNEIADIIDDHTIVYDFFEKNPQIAEEYEKFKDSIIKSDGG